MTLHAVELKVAERAGSPIGREIQMMREAIESLAQEYGENGNLPDSTLYDMSAGLDRLRLMCTLLTVRAELREQAEAISGLIEGMDTLNRRTAFTRTQGGLTFQLREIEEIAQRYSA
jgi:hypothetical protein